MRGKDISALPRNNPSTHPEEADVSVEDSIGTNILPRYVATENEHYQIPRDNFMCPNTEGEEEDTAVGVVKRRHKGDKVAEPKQQERTETHIHPKLSVTSELNAICMTVRGADS